MRLIGAASAVFILAVSVAVSGLAPATQAKAPDGRATDPLLPGPRMGAGSPPISAGDQAC